MNETYVVWFRNDFRFHDNPAVHAALNEAQKSNGNILFVFHLHPDFTGNTDLSNDYFFQTVRDFAEECEKINIKLHIISGTPKEAFNILTDRAAGINTVFHARDFTPFALKRDEEVRQTLYKQRIRLESVRGNYIHEPFEITKNNDEPYKVYTPYSKQWLRAEKPVSVQTNTEEITRLYGRVKAVDAESEQAFSTVVKDCSSKWKRIGEKAALHRLEFFIKNILPRYHDSRDLPEKAGTSRLSPYLRTGALSVRQVYKAAVGQLEGKDSSGAETFIKELAWRDFYAMILTHFPETAEKEFQEKYRDLSWNNNQNHFSLWKQGMTGFPIVDAGMRQLKQVGWMHNRLRMITASFLTKDFQMDWRLGEKYFGEKLIDYDPASNIGGWQWAGSVGTDAVPYFRVFSPIRQSERFDPDGSFIRRYVPELKDVPDKFIHEPHKMPPDIQNKASCRIGKDYPQPIVDHKQERKRAIAMFKDEEGLS
jgi:deoxyribodipyrimidine photo-lyase